MRSRINFRIAPPRRGALRAAAALAFAAVALGSHSTATIQKPERQVLLGGLFSLTGDWSNVDVVAFTENRDRLNAVQVRNPKSERCVAPGVKTVHDNTYKPLSRPLFVYVKGSSFQRREVQAFVDYIFDNEVRIAQRARFVPLTKTQLRRARTNFHLAVAATRGG